MKTDKIKDGRRDIFSGGLQYLGLPFNSFSVDIFSAPKNPYRATSAAAQSFGRALHCIPLRPKQHEKVTIFKSYNLHGLFALRHDFYKSYNLSREDINFIHPVTIYKGRYERAAPKHCAAKRQCK